MDECAPFIGRALGTILRACPTAIHKSWGWRRRTTVQPFNALRIRRADTTLPSRSLTLKETEHDAAATAPRRAARRMSSEDTLALWREYRRTNDRRPA